MKRNVCLQTCVRVVVLAFFVGYDLGFVHGIRRAKETILSTMRTEGRPR
jgi:ABC-type antimicrobial peptide transport system permease subunit